jgi:hypothetical protein
MTPTAVSAHKDSSLAEILVWWLVIAIFAAVALVAGTSPAGAQQTGPLPAAAPSDSPPPVSSGPAAAPKLIAGKPDLSGTWALNKDESDDPRQAMQEAAGNSGGGNGGNGGNGGGGPRMGGGGGWGGGGGGWGGRGGGGNGGYGGGGGRRGGQGGENLMNDLSQLTIAQNAKSATVTGDSGHILAQYSADAPAQTSSSRNGPTMKNSTPGESNTSNGSSNSSSSSNSNSSANGGNNSAGNQSSDAPPPPAAQWQGSQLVAVQQGRRGTTTRTFELSPDGKQLYVTTKIDNPRFSSPVTFRLVYDPAQSSE